MQKWGALVVLCGCVWFGSGCGGAGGGATVSVPAPAPAVPGQVTGLTATLNGSQVNLSWTAVSGATGYNLKRSETSGGPYTIEESPSTNSCSDTGVSAGTTVYYVVSATNAAGEGANSAQITVNLPAAKTVSITVDAMAGRHAISPYIYGVNFPPTASYLQDSGATLARWGGNASSRYNWKLFAYNSANDWYFQNQSFNALGSSKGEDSTQFLQQVVAAGAAPVMTLPMLNWVAKSQSASDYSFSVAKYGPQCGANPYLADDGDGLKPDCKTPITGNDPTDANVELLDQPGNGDPAGTVYRNQWVQALTPAFGASPHFYDMDNEPDIWGSTHRDVHPSPATYNELLNRFVTEAGNLKGWDPKAITLAPVSCCWEFYWNSAAGASDKSAHGNLDFWPWWLNEVYWREVISGQKLLDVFDFHAYPETSATGLTTAQLDALGLRSTRDWWDPNYTSEAWIGTNNVTSMQPLPHVEARLLRATAMVHSIAPDLPISVTEWNFGLTQQASGQQNATTEDPIAVALSDADAWGLLGQFNLFAASRWEAPDPSTPSYQILKLFRNADGNHDGFASVSVSATNDAGDAGLFSTFAAVDANGQRLTLLVVNKMPAQPVTGNINLKGFTASQVTAYTVSQASPTITAASPAAFSSQMTFPPYSATLLVITGTSTPPAAEWALHPGTVMVPAGGSVVLHPEIVSGSGTVTLGSIQTASGISGSITQASVTAAQQGAITITAGSTPGFYPYTVTGQDSGGGTETQSGWIEVGNPAATLSTSGDGQSASAGSTIPLSVTVNPGASGATAAGLDILFTTDAGTLSGGAGSPTRQLATTDSSGAATIQLTLPSLPGQVHVTAETPYPIGHPVATFTETAQ